MDERVIDFVWRAAAKHLPLQRMWLFGSRARGDARARSDYDFAIDAGDVNASAWSGFWNEVDEEVPTLCGIDLVDYARAEPVLKKRIESEGRLIVKNNPHEAAHVV